MSKTFIIILKGLVVKQIEFYCKIPRFNCLPRTEQLIDQNRNSLSLPLNIPFCFFFFGGVDLVRGVSFRNSLSTSPSPRSREFASALFALQPIDKAIITERSQIVISGQLNAP